MAAAGRRWQRCSSCGCRLMSASGQRPCCPSHGRGHHLPGRSTSIAALWRTAWLQESACWAVAVERWARRGATRRRKGLFQPFVRYLTHLDLEAASWTHPHPLCKRKDQSRIKSARSLLHMKHDKQLRDTQLTAAATTYNNNNCAASTHTHLSHSHD